MNARHARTRRLAVRGLTVGVVAAACCGAGGAAYADGAAPSAYTVYADDRGVAENGVTVVTAALHAAGEPAIGTTDSAVDAAKDDGDGGSAICSTYLTRPHATPSSPTDGDIYLEGEAHLECASTRVDADFTVAIEWRIDYGVNGGEGSSGTHFQQGGSVSCSGSSRCPRSGEARASWGHVSRCYETGTYHATTIVLSGYYWYRGQRHTLGGLRSATLSGTYGRGC